MPATAVAASAFHRSATAYTPGRAADTSQHPSSSLPKSTNEGTVVKADAHDIRDASAARSTPPSGDHLTKNRSAPALTSKVSPPRALIHTGRMARPSASAATDRGTGT